MEHAWSNDSRKGRRFAMLMGAAALAFALVASGVASPQSAFAAGAADMPQADAVLSAQATTSLATTKAAAINSTAKKNAAALVKAAKATSGTNLQKLKKIFTYIAQPTDFGGKFASVGWPIFYFKAKDTANATYYPASQAAVKDNLGKWYKKYAIDAYKTKECVCHHYASLFAIAAKQALGSKATVKIASGSAEGNEYHSWVEVTIGKKTYVYDPIKGMAWARDTAKKSSFGMYCGSLKTASKVKSYYKKYDVSRYTVKL